MLKIIFVGILLGDEFGIDYFVFLFGKIVIFVGMKKNYKKDTYLCGIKIETYGNNVKKRHKKSRD